jgi:hypothetical protein
MLQTYEATLEPSGYLHFADATAPLLVQTQRVLVTVLSPYTASMVSPQTDADEGLGGAVKDWQAFSGQLKNSPNFAGDPLKIQQQLRNEWPVA